MSRLLPPGRGVLFKLEDCREDTRMPSATSHRLCRPYNRSPKSLCWILALRRCSAFMELGGWSMHSTSTFQCWPSGYRVRSYSMIAQKKFGLTYLPRGRRYPYRTCSSKKASMFNCVFGDDSLASDSACGSIEPPYGIVPRPCPASSFTIAEVCWSL